MQSWEYKVRRIPAKEDYDDDSCKSCYMRDIKQAEIELDDWGAHGWELVSVQHNKDLSLTLYLKRPC